MPETRNANVTISRELCKIPVTELGKDRRLAVPSFYWTDVMAKSLLKIKPGLQSWREAPGLLNYVECDHQGRVHHKQGGEHEELPTITNSFMQLGQMLGKSLGLADCDEVLIEQSDRQAFFAFAEERHVGMEISHDR